MAGLFDRLKGRQAVIAHYYGDTVRQLFILAGIIILVMTPVFRDRLPVSAYLGILIVLMLDIAAGLMNPLIPWLAWLESAIALGSCVAFEYLAIHDYAPSDGLFWTNQILAFIFFLALYFAVKTARSSALHQQKEQPSTRES